MFEQLKQGMTETERKKDRRTAVDTGLQSKRLLPYF